MINILGVKMEYQNEFFVKSCIYCDKAIYQQYKLVILKTHE